MIFNSSWRGAGRPRAIQEKIKKGWNSPMLAVLILLVSK
jgi:hypothetical protein